MSTRSQTRHHSYWGNAFATYGDLPNVAGSALQSQSLEDGDTAYVPGSDLLYVCIDPTLGAAVWSPQAANDDTRVIHTPGITPSRPTAIPGQEPTFVAFGTPTPWLLGLHYDKPQTEQAVYGYAKIQTSFVGPEASFHVHWTKNVDSDQSGKKVRWVLDYHVYDGVSEDVQVAPTRITWDVFYLDSGVSSRIVYRTPNSSNVPFVANYYVGFRLSYDVNETTLDGGPVVISCDILARQKINEGN